MEWIGKKEDEKIYPPLNSNDFFYEILKIDTVMYQEVEMILETSIERMLRNLKSIRTVG